MKLNKKETENLLFTHLSNFVKNNYIPNGNTPEQIKELFQKVALDFAQNNDVLDESFESKISKYRKNLSIPMINYCVDETIQTNVLNILKITEHFDQIPNNKYSDTNFSNGYYYIQHHPDELKLAFQKTLDFVYSLYPTLLQNANASVKEGRIKDIYDQKIISYVHRYGSDGDTIGAEKQCIYSLLDKFSRINFDLSREYGQPYYSNHTDEVPLCINPGSLERWESKKIKETTSQSKKKTKIKVL